MNKNSQCQLFLRGFAGVRNTAKREPWFTMLGGMEDTYRVRIGDIRISYVVFWQAQEIRIFEIKWRGKAYK